MNLLLLLARVLFQSYIDLIKIENLLISIAGYWTGKQNYTGPVNKKICIHVKLWSKEIP